MKKRVFIILGILMISFTGLVTLISAAIEYPGIELPTSTSQQGSFPLPQPGGIYINRRTDGIKNSFNQTVFGPKSCTAYGDPYSPINSNWTPGLFTYKYRILIPADYSSDVVRVELFDPDSINNTITLTTYAHSQIAIDKGYPITETAQCNKTQKDPCAINTNEVALLGSNPELSYDQINPFWMIRIDENRGSGAEDGNGNCSTPQVYTPRYNTETLFELSYNAQDDDGIPESIQLARYTGQSGDGIRDNGDHDTDMRWVSPGSAQSFDQSIFVPVDAESPKSFEIDLTQDVPNIIVNPLTGYRELYLEVTAVSGASENGFDIWAGPPTYTLTVPSEVNARNLHIINNPQTHNSGDITIFALETLPQNSNINIEMDLPLTYLSPEYAGQVISITAFDIDVRLSSIEFYMDTIDPSDWSLTFGEEGIPDPDGVLTGTRCLPGDCDDVWIDPAYRIQLPDFTPECNPNDPDPQQCTPFYGGRLMANFRSGLYDTYAWEIDVPPAPIIDRSQSCSNAFPIALSQDMFSVLPPGSGGNDYPEPTEFEYPEIPPSYHNFISHVPDVPLAQAQEGYVFRLYDGSESGDFGWLQWDIENPDNDETLSNDLAWPGNNELSLNANDLVLAKSNPISSTTIVQSQLNDHIDKHRTLRLVIWDQYNDGSSSYRMANIGIFRLIGYNIVENSVGLSWLTLEFVGWGTSCGKVVTTLQDISLSGPKEGFVNTPYNFLANIQPATASTPISYTWETDGQAPITQTNIFQDAFTFTWPNDGVKVITVTAQNIGEPQVQTTYSITLAFRYVYLPVIVAHD